MLSTFGKTKTILCSFCHSYDETTKHIFLECMCLKQLWNYLRLLLTNAISLPILTPETANFGFIDGIENSVYKITNYILSIFKLQIYKSRERGTLELSRLINEIKKIKLLEKKISPKLAGKLGKHHIKWEKTRRTMKI